MEAPYQKSWFKKGQADQSQKRSSRFSRHDQASKLNKLLEDQSVDLDANHKGFVSIVGAGPHDPDLLTVKAVKAIMSAEVLLYDRLVNKDILELASPQADWIYVGKRCGQPSIGRKKSAV